MNTINKTFGLPDCKIINTLIKKANSKTDYEFNYVHQLEEFRNRVSIEVSRINLLFPEYTPHDEKYHLKRLFFVADQMLGDNLIESMNVTELFMLSIGLYGHDWGMAISEDEKEYILNSDKKQSEVLTLLDDESFRIKEFCKNRNIVVENIQISDWQEYVRLTHAFRSGKRVKSYFNAISPGIAEFASRICEGHWLDFDIIDDYTSYPTDAAVHRDIVNVKAITIYVRLIDLLDFGEDRTPFVLWKFVAPRNKYSKLEWAKHRALQSVTFPKYQTARYIQVDGSTDDQNVYMSIMDLRRYVDDQFRQCSDILNRINHVYHKLNISHIDWRIAARGFEPILIQFEFDRLRMFEILGDEIYRSNPYVFIRELVQNSIDAIELRVEMLSRVSMSFMPKIEINVIEDDETYLVEIKDNGIGMDEYIIRNYLTVAGKSYYRSVDFQKEGLKMDPISRFGIGVLSCFMVADYLEIETSKDRNTIHKREDLEIAITSKENYFKIKRNLKTLSTGTVFRVFVNKSKLPRLKKKPFNFNVVDYLKKVAGFVEYPILVNENGSQYQINNPNVIPSNEEGSLSISYDFPIDRAILPQDLDAAKEYFVEKKFHLKMDLGLEDYDGCLTYLIPKSENIDVMNDGNSWPMGKAKIVLYDQELTEKIGIGWKREWTSFGVYYLDRDVDSPPLRCYSVYMDGILIENISPPSFEINSYSEENAESRLTRTSLYSAFISPQIVVNIPKPVGLKIDLARTTIESAEAWDLRIWKSLLDYFKKNELPNIIKKQPKDRLLALAKLITFYRIPDEIIIDHLIEQSEFPLPFLSPSAVEFKLFDNKKHETITLLPFEFSDECVKMLVSEYQKIKKYKGVLDKWNGDSSIINLKDVSYFSVMSSSLINLGMLVKCFINRHYFLSSIKFVTSPEGPKFPLVVQELKLKDGESVSITMDKIVTIGDLKDLDSVQVMQVYDLFKKEFTDFPLPVKFSKPYESSLFYSTQYLNIDSNFGKVIFDLCLSVLKTKASGAIPNEIVGKLVDMISDLPFIKFDFSNEGRITLSDLNSKVNKLIDTCVRHKIFENNPSQKIEIKFEDFVANSIRINKKHGWFAANFANGKYANKKSLWGEVLNDNLAMKVKAKTKKKNLVS